MSYDSRRMAIYFALLLLAGCAGKFPDRELVGPAQQSVAVPPPAVSTGSGKAAMPGAHGDDEVPPPPPKLERTPVK